MDGEDPSRDVGVRPATSNPEAGVCEAAMLLIWSAESGALTGGRSGRARGPAWVGWLREQAAGSVAAAAGGGRSLLVPGELVPAPGDRSCTLVWPWSVTK